MGGGGGDGNLGIPPDLVANGADQRTSGVLAGVGRGTPAREDASRAKPTCRALRLKI